MDELQGISDTISTGADKRKVTITSPDSPLPAPIAQTKTSLWNKENDIDLT